MHCAMCELSCIENKRKRAAGRASTAPTPCNSITYNALGLYHPINGDLASHGQTIALVLGSRPRSLWFPTAHLADNPKNQRYTAKSLFALQSRRGGNEAPWDGAEGQGRAQPCRDKWGP